MPRKHLKGQTLSPTATVASSPSRTASTEGPSLEREAVKGALMVMYSCVASYCHPQMLLVHVDNPITTKIIHHYSSSCQVTRDPTDTPCPDSPPEPQTGGGGEPPCIIIWALPAPRRRVESWSPACHSAFGKIVPQSLCCRGSAVGSSPSPITE